MAKMKVTGTRLAGSILSIVLLIALSSCAPKVRILYTASLNGNLLGCDCWGYPEAGLDKRAYYLAGRTKKPGEFLLDAGNILEEGRQPYLADLILETYRELDYDAVAVGVNELAEGADTLADRTALGSDLPFLSHNLLLDGEALSRDPLLLSAADDSMKSPLSIAVISLIDPEWIGPYLPLYKGRIEISDPSLKLEEQVSLAHKSGAAGVVVMAHGSRQWVEELFSDSRKYRRPELSIAAVILSGEELLIEDRLPGGIPILSPGEEGNRLGILELRLSRKPRWRNEFIEFHYLGPGDPEVAVRGKKYETWLNELRSES